MGRKRIRELKPLDKIGEEVDLDKCLICAEHPDCFSCMNGKCTALKSVDEDCVFYCPEQKAIDEAKLAYRRLKETRRFDLIRKYIKTFTALGVLDEEIDGFDREADALNVYEAADLDALMKQAPITSD